MSFTRRAVLGAFLLATSLPATALAADEPTFRITFNDGVIEPQRIEVPAKKAFKLELANIGKKPAEFESKTLHKEKVIAPGKQQVMTIRPLEPGDYDFFDDFFPNATPGKLVAK